MLTHINCTYTHPNPHTHPHPLHHTIPSSYASSPHHPHHPLIILIIPSSYSSYSSYASSSSYSSSSSSSSWDFDGLWSLLYETNHPFQFALGSRAHGSCSARESSRSWGFTPGRRGPCLWRASTLSFFFKRILEWNMFLFSRKII